MKDMKKVWALCLALLLIVSSLASCQKQEETDGGESAFRVIYNDVEIELGKSADPILKKLGEANSENEIFDCGEGNSRIRYRYDSLTLYVMKSGDTAVVDEIELLDDLAETGRGICIGDGEDKVRAEYGDPTSDKNGTLIYSKNNMQIQFDIADGKVSGIGFLRRTQ